MSSQPKLTVSMMLKKLPAQEAFALTSTPAMSAAPQKKSGKYKIVIVQEGTRHVSNIEVIDMDGWRLFECFLPAAETVVYLGQDEGDHTLRWIDMGDKEDEQYACLLIDALKRFQNQGPQA